MTDPHYALTHVIRDMWAHLSRLATLERQARAVETFQQRVYSRITLAFAETLPRINDDTFVPQHANRFFEAEQLTRALAAMVADLFKVAVAGTIATGLLTFFSPFFLVYLGMLCVGFVGLLMVRGIRVK